MTLELDLRPVLITAAEIRLAVLAVVLVIAISAGSALVSLPEGLRLAVLFVHLGSLIVGFGAVLSIDWYGLLWLRGRATLADLVGHSHRAGALTWGGLAGLCLSGMLLGPQLGSPLTLIKIVAVAGAAAVGVCALAAGRRLRSWRDTPPRRVLLFGAVLAGASQVFWWTAVVIGFLAREAR
ncbi:hypothetical protein [Microlunatus parietis]|uniref:Uncharacterized protein n=1 Tax=Microlunatus parietis TaxID=682979 RepID=A0A7Y9LD74_9ACTN|nr:hypothetical protein [Microlunatus parietis]NYE71626.1 hypothetical protein [Microlunatus parietis]